MIRELTPKLMKNLAGFLSRFTNPNSQEYNPEFAGLARAKHPEWFVDSAADNKKQLLAMPVGCKRPSYRTPLGLALYTYTDKEKCYDPEFDAAIRKRQPQWWPVDGNKKLLLAMPKGSQKPGLKTKIGLALYRYTKFGNKCYDPEFDAAIRKRQPGWFAYSRTKKQQLLEMPIGCQKPNVKSSTLGLALFRYTRKGDGCYDPIFDAAIRKRQPGWFISGRATAIENKKLLLAMPIGCPRPSRKSDLGRPLSSYVCKSHSAYDAEFANVIRVRQPGWFKHEQATDQLLAVA